jgi:hypothetical protein
MVLIDSAGVEVLARVAAWTRGSGGELELRSASPALWSSWSWPAGPSPTATILPTATANRPAPPKETGGPSSPAICCISHGAGLGIVDKDEAT